MTIDWMDSFNVTKCPVVYAQDLGSLCLKFVKINNLTSYIDPWFAQYIPSDYPVFFNWVSSFIWLCEYCGYIQTVFWLSVELDLWLGAQPRLNWASTDSGRVRWTQLRDSRLNFSQDPRTWLRLVSAVFTPKTSHLVPTLMYRKWINQAAF